MIIQYEHVVADDMKAMAVDMECYPVYMDVTIDRTQGNPFFGSITHIRMTVIREPPGETNSNGVEDSGTGNEPGAAAPREPVRPVEQVKSIETGKKTRIAAEVPMPDETLNRLRRKVKGYYGLQITSVEI